MGEKKKKLTRKEVLLNICNGLNENGKAATVKLIDEILFLERQLTELKKMPFMSINPRNPAQQRQTAAAKQYKELLQQYTNCVKILLKVTGVAEVEEESPLRAFLRHMHESE
jgi:hypothetical protein